MLKEVWTVKMAWLLEGIAFIKCNIQKIHCNKQQNFSSWMGFDAAMSWKYNQEGGYPSDLISYFLKTSLFN